MSVKPRAVFIGKESVAAVLKKIKPDWEFLPTVSDIPELWQKMTDGEIDNNIQAIFVLDTFFNSEGENTDFEKLVVSMSPYCFFGVINYHPEYRESMNVRISDEDYNSGVGEKAHYYFIDVKQPSKSIDESLESFYLESSAEDAIAILSGRDRSDSSTVNERAQSPLAMRQESEYLGQIVAITSSKGGSGKSTVSTVLSSYIAHASEAAALKMKVKRPLKVIVLDIDIRDGQLGFLTGNSKPTVINLRLHGVSDKTVEDTVIHSAKLKVDLLLAPKRPRNSDDTPPDFYIELIQNLRNKYDYIFLDTSVNYLDPLLEKVAYPVADQIIFVTEISIQSVYSMTRWIQEVTKPKEHHGMGINPNKIGIVVNKAIADVNMDTEKIEKSSLGLPILAVLPSSPKLAVSATNMQSMELLLKHPEIRGGIRRLARAIVGKKWELDDGF